MCDCVAPDLVTDWASGDVVCRGCGVVVEGHILDESREWRAHEQDGAGGGTDRRRAGGGVDRQGRPTGTYLEAAGGPAKRRRFVCAERGDAGLHEGLRQVESFVADFGLSTTCSIAGTAKELFEDLHGIKCVRSDTRRAVAAAAVYFGCKMERAGRELRLVAQVCEVDPKALNAATNEFKRALAGKPYYAALLATMPAGTMLDIFLDRLKLSADQRKRVWRTASSLDRLLQGRFDCGRKPRTICSGIVWVALQREGIDHVTKKHVTDACAVCQQTLDKVVAHIRATV